MVRRAAIANILIAYSYDIEAFEAFLRFYRRFWHMHCAQPHIQRCIFYPRVEEQSYVLRMHPFVEIKDIERIRYQPKPIILLNGQLCL